MEFLTDIIKGQKTKAFVNRVELEENERDGHSVERWVRVGLS